MDTIDKAIIVSSVKNHGGAGAALSLMSDCAISLGTTNLSPKASPQLKPSSDSKARFRRTTCNSLRITCSSSRILDLDGVREFQPGACSRAKGQRLRANCHLLRRDQLIAVA